MAHSLSHYYSSAKSSFGSINPKEATQLGEDWMITAAAGAGMALVASALGGLDKNIAGMSVPLDGMAAVGVGALGLMTRSSELKVASIALGGSAAVRTFGKIFSKGLGAHGEIDEWASGGYSGMFGFGGAPPQFNAYNPNMGWGADHATDRLVEASRAL